jgi:spondin N
MRPRSSHIRPTTPTPPTKPMSRLHRLPFLALLLSAGLYGCGDDSTGPTPPDGDTATYRVTFQATWSATTHPTNFPGGPHFSGLIGATHGPGASFWADGGTASAGIRNVAETGGKSPLTSEIESAIATGTAYSEISGGGINPSPGTVSVEFEIHSSQPLVTLVSMIAPSPDWFVGVYDFSLREEGEWTSEVTAALPAYDAGTDSGSTYTSANQPTEPQAPIAQITSSPLGGSVPLGTFTFTLISG